MTIDDSLEHPWIKVGVVLSLYVWQYNIQSAAELSLYINKPSNYFLYSKEISKV